MNQNRGFHASRAFWLVLAFSAAIALLASRPGSTPAAEAAESGALPAWGIVPSPNGGAAPNQLNAVAVLSDTDVWAAGHFGDFLYPDPAVHHWDGVAWRLVEVPAAVGTAELYGVAAVAADDIWFVGGKNVGGQALILRWNGAALEVVPHPNPGTFNRLYGVAAAADDDVWAVGEYASGGVSRPLTLHWDGAVWTQVASPTRPGYTALQAVEAIASDDVWAVGYGDDSTFAIHWDGAAWTAFPTPNAGSGSTFKGLSAVSSAEVWAVGDGANGLLAARWNGTRWRRVQTPQPPGFSNDLNDVVALASNDAWAVGYFSDSHGDWKTLILHWDGSSWRKVPSPSPDPTLNSLFGVDGVPGGDLWAVGEGGYVDGGQTTLALRWDGAAWRVVPSANGGLGDNSLAGISAVSADDIWSVGDVDGDSLTLHWDGAAWSLVPSPNLQLGAELEGVLALAADDVWAVGTTGPTGLLNYSTVTMHWDGAAWTIVPSPDPGGNSVDRLYAVDGAAANDVWAVGEYWDASGRSLGAILHWDGVAWSIVPNDCGTALLGLEVVSAADIWAVGDSTTCHFDGLNWTVVPSPQPRPEFFEIALPLEDVSAIAPDDIWAVGASVKDFAKYLVWTGFAEHWDGTEWTRFDLADAQVLYGVEAVAANDVWAAGTTGFGPVILHYDRQSWSEVPTPQPGGGQLNDITAAPGGRLWAVGSSFFDFEGFRTLVMEAPSTTQGSVIGDTGVSGALVSWFGPTTGSVSTDSFGEYTTAGLPAGDYTFFASAAGCTPATAEVTVIAGVVIVQNLPISC
jgi:hypothetical protein